MQELFTADHQGNKKKNFQIGNKILLNWKSKDDNRSGYFNTELIRPIAPFFFDDKKRTVCILSATSILKILLPERQINKKIYNSFEIMLEDLKLDHWIKLYIFWELSLVKELGFEISFFGKNNGENKTLNFIEINNKTYKIPKILYEDKTSATEIHKNDVKEALAFNKNLLMENFITPNGLRFPIFRNILESYFVD